MDLDDNAYFFSDASHYDDFMPLYKTSQCSLGQYIDRRILTAGTRVFVVCNLVCFI